MTEAKEYRFEILDITYINGERSSIDYDYRKKKFETEAELDSYVEYLEKKLNKKLFLTIKDKFNEYGWGRGSIN